MNSVQIERKLQELRERWKTASPGERAIIERRAKALKIALRDRQILETLSG